MGRALRLSPVGAHFNPVYDEDTAYGRLASREETA